MADIREKTPVSTKASAGGKGHNGAALATVFLQEDERSAREAWKKQESMKDRLKKLCKLTEPDHVEFRATLEEKRAEIRAAAEKAGMSQADYFKSGAEGSIANVLNVSVSLWQKMSVAAQNGFKPDYSMGWNDLSQKATEFNKSKGNGTATGNGTAGSGAKGTPLLDKAKQFAKANLKGADGVVKADLIKPQEVVVGSSKVMQIPLVESIMLMLSMADAPDEVCDHLIEKVQQFKVDRAKARDAAKAAADKAKKDSATAPETGSPGREQSPADQLIAEGKTITKRGARRVKAEA